MAPRGQKAAGVGLLGCGGVAFLALLGFAVSFLPDPRPVPPPAPQPAVSAPPPAPAKPAPTKPAKPGKAGAQPATAPAARPSPSAAPSSGTGPTVYATRDGEKYHRAGCKYLAKSSRPVALSEVGGLEPCSICEPPR